MPVPNGSIGPRTKRALVGKEVSYGGILGDLSPAPALINTEIGESGPPVILDPKVLGISGEELRKHLFSSVIGQSDAINGVIEVYQQWRSGLSASGKPIGSFLFLGPTGTGKTYLAEQVATEILGNPKALLRIDCAEYQNNHDVSKLIGAPPGYLGHRETTPLLTQSLLDSYQTDREKINFVLFDEIEKAADSVWTLLLGILDKGIMTTGDNRVVNFNKTMIFLTSNLGAKEMGKLVRPGLGFHSGKEVVDSKGLGKVAVGAAKKHFTPEFMNRLDQVIAFHSISEAGYSRIFDLEWAAIQSRITNGVGVPGIMIRFTPELKSEILRIGIDAEYGARFLKRSLERKIVTPLSNIIASRQVTNMDIVTVGFRDGEFVFERGERK